MFPAWHYDGQNAVRHEIMVGIEAGQIVFAADGTSVPMGLLIPMGDHNTLLFGHRDIAGWRLGFNATLSSDIIAKLPKQEHHGGLLDRIGIIPAFISCAAIAAFALMGLWKGAEIAAFMIPEKWEIAYGEAMTGDFVGQTCINPAGQKALDGLATRLSGDGKPIKVHVVNLPMVNAAALPGRQIILLDGLIKDAKSPDEVAGVLAHEIGHVEHRHVMASLIRSFGISLLIGGVDGGTLAQGMLSSRYSRATERDADSYAITGLAKANISPKDTAGFFDRMGKMEPKMDNAAKVLGYIASHPQSSERRALFLNNVRKSGGYAPALNAAEWDAVKSMCPKREEGRGKIDFLGL